MNDVVGSEYLRWVKTRTPAQFNLAASGVLPCSPAELGAHLDDLQITGPGLYGYEPLQHAIAAHCRVPAECVVATSGTSMANFIAMSVLIRPVDEVFIENPVYEPLLAVARHLGAEIKRFSRAGATLDFISKRTRLIIMTNLHNPTCAGLEERWLKELAEVVRGTGTRVLIDEVYLQCMYEKASSAFHHGVGFVTTSSLTKAYGLGGLRCGWILAEPDLAQRMWQLKDLIDPSAPHPAELLSVMAFRKLDSLAARAKQLIDKNRVLLHDFLRSCPHVDVNLPDYGTCVFPRYTKGNADRFLEVVHNDFDTDVVPGRFFEMPDHFRLGIGGDSTILAEGLDRLRCALEQL